jgi:ribulose kinase
MDSKITKYVLGLLLLGSLVFAFYSYDKADKLSDENKQLQTKYEEAIIDAENAAQREEKLKEELQKALKDSEEHRKQAEEALSQLQKKKR